MLSKIQAHDDTIEIARLTNKHPLLVTCLGGVLPGVSQVFPSPTKNITAILDVACGPGGWMFECARAYKHAHIVGVDTRETMVRCASQRSKRYPNIQIFHLSSYLDFSRFQDASFDIISFQCTNLHVCYEQWIHLLRECKRILRKGGCIRFTEFEHAHSNSPALQRWNTLYEQIEDLGAFPLRNQNWFYELEPLLAPDFLEPLLLPHLINFSYGALVYEGWTHDLLSQAQQCLPIMVHHDFITQEQSVSLLRQMQLEFALPNFHALQYGMTIWRRKN
ncbi:class I SAM-dependent methyltransferase [Dictyobacter vulcani]|uniref:class I SAM-dependent methyltransferase n=1 Tax=Dictyobacter vulcani TaxID=2607529 RepID=UPI001250AA0D|nr:class I SAM-dependent methyltransferase [Dictyobacter vulcani]